MPFFEYVGLINVQGPIKMPNLGETWTTGVLDTPKIQKNYQKFAKKAFAVASFKLGLWTLRVHRRASRPSDSQNQHQFHFELYNYAG